MDGSVVFARWRQPPGEYDWTCASFGPPESTTQMANRSVQPFLHSSQQSVVRHIGATWQILLNMSFFGPTKTQTTNRSVQPLLHSSRQSPYTVKWASLSPKTAPSHWGSRPPYNSWFLGPAWAHNPNAISIGSAVFEQITAECPLYFTMGHPFPPQNSPFPWGDLDPHLTHASLGSLESSTKCHLNWCSRFCTAH